MQILFEDYITKHLDKCEFLSRRKIYACSSCDTEFSKQQVHKRKSLGHSVIKCPVCESSVSLADATQESRWQDEFTQNEIAKQKTQIDSLARTSAQKTTYDTILMGKIETSTYDVFLCYDGHDRRRVREICEQLKERGILPWIDESDLRPGSSWLDKIEEIISIVDVASVFIGADNEYSFAKKEIGVLLRKNNKSRFRIIPVLLENASDEADWSTFLDDFHWVDFRNKFPSPIEQLIWGITGSKSTKI